MEEFPSVDAIMGASKEELEAVDEIGPRIAESILEFFSSERNRILIERMRSHELRFVEEKEDRGIAAPDGAGAALAGKIFVLTGTLAGMTRDEATRRISGARGQGDRHGQPQDGLPRGGRQPRLEADEGTGAWSSGPRRTGTSHVVVYQNRRTGARSRR